MDASKPILIVNPRSGGSLSDKRWTSLVGPITDGLGPFDVRFTEAPGDGRRLAHEEAAAGRKLVVAVGGDGTISEVADGLMAANARAGGNGAPGGATEMGILPRGTGGDFRRTLDLPSDLAEAARRVREAKPHVIDAGRVTFVAHGGETVTRTFVNVASFGFSAAVATRANASSKRFGAKASFLGATLRSLAAFDVSEVYLSADGGERQRRTVLLGAVGNGRFFGGGMRICPDGCLDDGLLDLVTVGDLGRLGILAKVGSLYEGTHLSLKEVSAARVRTVEVTPVDGEAVIPIELDGETPGRLPAHFEVIPAALRLRF